MCLELERNSEKKLKRLLAMPGNTITVWKMLRKVDDGSLRSFHFNHKEWEVGIHRSDRETASLSEEEIRNRDVHKGFHFYLKKRDAKNCAQGYDRAIAKFRVLKEDIVAIGDENGRPGLVATKTEMVETFGHKVATVLKEWKAGLRDYYTLKEAA
jgi:hypothetical protein